MKVSIIFGTRPEAIKLAPVINEFKKRSVGICHVCVTAQHREMLDQVLNVFGITPDADLDLMTYDQCLADFTSKAISAIDYYLKKEKPNVILVQGDTTTVFCASLAAFYNKIPVGHVEAGLRTGNLKSPWPEEVNRVLTSKLAAWHFAPTRLNRDNLLKEGVPEETIFVTGNTIIDALLMAVEKVKSIPPKIEGLPGEGLDFMGNNKYILMTGHRRENFGIGFKNICYAIKEISNKFPDIHFIYPVHLNPNVQGPVRRILNNKETLVKGRIHLIPPQAYLPFVYLMYHSYFLLTDSGGVQEEAPCLGKPVLVMRDTTERPEGILAGAAKLIGTNRETIVKEVTHLLVNDLDYLKMVQTVNPYGDGKAGERIVDVVLKKIKE